MSKKTKNLELENLGSIITLKGTSECLGMLWDAKESGHGIYCPSHGEVSRFGVTSDHAKAHNEALDLAMIEGLDKNCEIGQGGAFYLNGNGRGQPYTIKTFLGTLVADGSTGGVHVETTKRRSEEGTYWLNVWFWRGGKQYKGSNNGFDDLVHFKRVK